MRIGIITGEYPPMHGGVGAYTEILARHLIVEGQDVRLFSTRSAESADIPLTSPLRHWGPGCLNAVRQWAARESLDMVNLQFQTSAFKMSPWVHFLPEALGPTPLVTTFHDLNAPYLFPKAGGLRAWIVKRLAQRSAGVIVTNQEDATRLAHLPHCVRIPIGSNILALLPEDFDPLRWRKAHGLAREAFVLAHFGLLNASKGLDTLLESMVMLRDSGVPVQLIIVGGSTGSTDPTNAAYKREIAAFIQQHGLTDHVYSTGFLEDAAVAAYLRGSDAVVLPFRDGASFRRGSLMAAIHYGAVIVTTQPHVNIPEFVHDGNMLFVPADDPAALRDSLRQIHDSPPEHLRQGALQLDRHFTWDQITADYLACFRDVLENRA